MRTPSRPIVTLMCLPMALAAAGLVAGCEESGAPAQRDALRTIEETGLELRKLLMAVPTVAEEAEFEEARRALGELSSRLDRLDGAAPGQQAAAALLRASVQEQMGALEGNRLRQLQRGQRLRRAELLHVVDAGRSLARLATLAEQFDPTTERAMLDAARSEATRELDALKGRIGDLERPIDDLNEENRSKRQAAQALNLEERSLRQDAAGRGHAAGFPIFLNAIDLRQQANELNIQAARNEIQIAELEPERDRAVTETSMLETMVAAIALAERDLGTGVDGARERATALRGAVNELHRRAAPMAEEIAASARGPIAESYERAVKDLELAVQSAGRASGGTDVPREVTAAARQATLIARQALAMIHVSRLLDIRDIVAAFPDGVVTADQSSSASALAKTLGDLRTQQLALEADVKARAQEALSAALEATTQLGDRPAVAQTRESLTRMLATLEGQAAAPTGGRGAANDAASGAAGAAGGIGGGMESPEAVLAFLNGLNPGDPAAMATYFDLQRSATAEGRQMLAALRGMNEDTVALNAAIVERWGAEALAEASPVPMPSPGTLRIGEQSDRQATIVSPELPSPIRLVRSPAGWFIDADSTVDPQAAAMMGPMLGMFESIRPAMRKNADEIAGRVRSGEFESAAAALEAFHGALMAEMMGGAMSDVLGDMPAK